MRPSGPDAPGALSRRRAEPLEALVVGVSLSGM